jgi:cyclic pyranopterin phosphate synthase
MPFGGVAPIEHKEILSFEEILRVVSIMADLGVNKVRLTGGEPLVRKGIATLAKRIKEIRGIEILGLTTNGVLLGDMAKELSDSGVDAINISIDTTDEMRYKNLTLFDMYNEVRRGLLAALENSFNSVKVNCVLSPFSIPDDWIHVAAFAKDNAIDVRFIEWMPMAGEEMIEQNIIYRMDTVKGVLGKEFGEMTPCSNEENVAACAKMFSVHGFIGRLGFIPAMSSPFCKSCNRLRLTSTGDLRLCLFYDKGLALKSLLRGGASDEYIAKQILKTVEGKPAGHIGHRVNFGENSDTEAISSICGMSQVGG